LSWKKPDSLDVFIKKSDNGYFAKVTSLSGNVVTQAKTGQELIEMVNDAVYAYLDIPQVYREHLGYFMPPEEVRAELKAEIPQKYLNKKIGLVKA
jgi:predicted RNase H-like HicB family nuclease